MSLRDTKTEYGGTTIDLVPPLIVMSLNKRLNAEKMQKAVSPPGPQEVFTRADALRILLDEHMSVPDAILKLYLRYNH